MTALAYAEARAIADEVRGHLAPACQAIKLAGSLRRGAPEANNIDLVVIPHYQPSLIPGVPGYPMIDPAIDGLLRKGYLMPGSRNGSSLKTFQHPDGIAIHLHICEADNFGNTFAIATGDAEFARAMVAGRHLGGPIWGLAPDGLRHFDNRWWRDGVRQVCRTEREFFAALGIEPPDPASRTAELARRLHERAATVAP